MIVRRCNKREINSVSLTTCFTLLAKYWQKSTQHFSLKSQYFIGLRLAVQNHKIGRNWLARISQIAKSHYFFFSTDDRRTSYVHVNVLQKIAIFHSNRKQFMELWMNCLNDIKIESNKRNEFTTHKLLQANVEWILNADYTIFTNIILNNNKMS